MRPWSSRRCYESRSWCCLTQRRPEVRWDQTTELKPSRSLRQRCCLVQPHTSGNRRREHPRRIATNRFATGELGPTSQLRRGWKTGFATWVFRKSVLHYNEMYELCGGLPLSDPLVAHPNVQFFSQCCGTAFSAVIDQTLDNAQPGCERSLRC